MQHTKSRILNNKKECEFCNKIFYVNSLKRQLEKRFCCKSCAIQSNGRNNKGKKRSKEVKEHLSRINTGKLNNFYGKSHTTKAKRKMSEALKWNDEDFNHCSLNDKEIECLNGMLLADGHIEGSKLSGRLTYGCKFKETLDDIQNNIKNLTYSPLWQSKITLCWHLKSRYFKELKEIRNKWYPKSKKIVPIDIKLTPICLYWWFIGDGYRCDYNIKFCTDAFSLEDKKLLVNKLHKIGFSTAKIEKSGRRILISGYDVSKFLNTIKNNVPVLKEYEYKFSNKRRIKK